MDTSKVDPSDCLDVIITDYQLHATKARKPKSLGRQVAKAFKNKKPGRAFSNDLEMNEKSGVLSIDLGIEELQELARKRGKKYIRLLYPKKGVPIFLGNDTQERVEALKKRVLTRNIKKGV